MSTADCVSHTKDSAKQFAESLRENSVEYVRFELPDLAGLSRGKTVPIDHVESYTLNGLNLYGGAVTLDTSSLPIPGTGYNEDINFADCLMVPDPEFRQQCSLARQHRAGDLRHQMVRRPRPTGRPAHGAEKHPGQSRGYGIRRHNGP